MASAFPHVKSRPATAKVVWRLFVLACAVYAVPLVGLSVFQSSLVFDAAHSRRATAQAHEAQTPLPPGETAVHLHTALGDTITAYFGRALLSDGKLDARFARRPTLLFFYGKGSSLAWERPLMASLRRLDMNVLMPDYVGFGLSGGQASEAGCFATASACYDFLRTRPDIDSKRLVIAGYSLGSGVAVDLAARKVSEHQPVAGLALFAAYTSLADEAHVEYPIYPAWLLRGLLKYPFASLQKMPQVTCPVLIVHSRDDRLIPFRMADTLAAASGGEVTRLTLRDADHGFYFTAAGRQIFPALASFVRKVSSP